MDKIGDMIKKQVKSKFESFSLEEVTKVKPGPDNQNHNKLRFYSSLKGCFKKEAYIDLVPNRAQRSNLTRLRISNSQIAIEVQRYRRPRIPES